MSEYAPLRTAEDDGAEHEGARQAAGTPSRAALRERVEAAEARSAAARAEAARFDEAQQRGGRGPPDAPSSLEREQPEPEPEPMSLPLVRAQPASPAPPELVRQLAAMQARHDAMEQRVEALTPQRGVYRDDAVPESPSGGVSKEHAASIAEVMKLRQKLSLAKAVTGDQERLDRVLSAVADDGLLLPGATVWLRRRSMTFLHANRTWAACRAAWGSRASCWR